ncbi:HLGFF motif protein [Bergeriella denitrificans]|uniref:Lipoprotein n=1 Tax=Bergeriella denitrificans TaxID=494 RepID=A0A378UGZ3_BERDE|nr:hypothetical protein [Bergeriella denitrificans]STZ75771.1 Uncharacterised protein [Bergeriella denitrificans]
MHYFSIHTQAGGHLGFLIMTADDESAERPQSGGFVVKLQSEEAPQDKEAVALLRPLQSLEAALLWRVEKDRVTLYDGDTPVGSIRNEYLTLQGKVLLLNDLTGIM